MPKEAPELKPRGYGGILDATFDLYKQNFLLLVGIAGIVYIPLAVFQVLLMNAERSVAFVASLLLAIISMFFAIFVSGAMTKAVSDVYLGQEVSLSESYGYVLKRWLPYLWTNILCVLLVYAGIIALVIPGIVFSFWIAFASEVFVIEGKSGWKAIQRSRELVGGHWGRVFVLMLLVGVLAVIAQMLPASLFTRFFGDSMTGTVLSAAWQGVASTAIAPIQMTALILLYYDIRIRKEAFDLQVLAESMAEWGKAPAPEPAASAEVPLVSEQDQAFDLAAAPASDALAAAQAEATAETGTCSSCGRPLLPEAGFCEHCGKSVEQAPTEGTGDAPGSAT